MSFRCDITGKVSELGEKEIRLVVETRECEYFDNKEDPETATGKGTEIVHEIRLTHQGLRIFVQKHPNDTEARERLEGLERAKEARRKYAEKLAREAKAA